MTVGSHAGYAVCSGHQQSRLPLRRLLTDDRRHQGDEDVLRLRGGVRHDISVLQRNRERQLVGGAMVHAERDDAADGFPQPRGRVEDGGRQPGELVPHGDPALSGEDGEQVDLAVELPVRRSAGHARAVTIARRVEASALKPQA